MSAHSPTSEKPRSIQPTQQTQGQHSGPRGSATPLRQPLSDRASEERSSWKSRKCTPSREERVDSGARKEASPCGTHTSGNRIPIDRTPFSPHSTAPSTSRVPRTERIESIDWTGSRPSVHSRQDLGLFAQVAFVWRGEIQPNRIAVAGDLRNLRHRFRLSSQRHTASALAGTECQSPSSVFRHLSQHERFLLHRTAFRLQSPAQIQYKIHCPIGQSPRTTAATVRSRVDVRRRHRGQQRAHRMGSGCWGSAPSAVPPLHKNLSIDSRPPRRTV